MSLHSQIGTLADKRFMPQYLDALALVERLHRLLLDVIKDEFERLGMLEVNAVQALLLFNSPAVTSLSPMLNSNSA